MAVFNTPKVRRFVRHIQKTGSVTKRTQSFYKGMGYYAMIWHLRDQHVVEENGLNNKNEKMWILTKKGDKLCTLFDEFEAIEKKIEGLVAK